MNVSLPVMTTLAAGIATIESVCAIVDAQNGARNSRRRDMRVSEEEFAEMQAKRSRWTTGGNINGDRPAAGVADNTAGFYPADAGSTPARPAQSTSGVVPRGGGRSTTMDACTAGRSGPLTSLPRAYERDILAACLQAIELHPRVAWCHRMNCGGMQNSAGQYVKFGFKGMADITGQLKDGRRLEVEVKRPGESLTFDQQAFLHRVIACGGVAFVARSVDDVMRALRPLPESA